MNVKKFYASTTREALRQVRDVLGADAIILSNRQVENGIEIMAVADMDVASLDSNATPVQPQEAEMEAQTPPTDSGPDTIVPEPISEIPENATAQPEPAIISESMVQDIVREMKTMRGMLQGQLGGLVWQDIQRRSPEKMEVLRCLLSMGFSPALARRLIDKMPGGYDIGKAVRWVKAALVHNMQSVNSGEDIIEHGGVYALVGPTGVGKTTTVAKLAARCTLQHGSHKLALITTDSYRIGAHEQLRIYGKILGIPVHAVKDEADLHATLADLQNKHLVLIDTVGMSQRDRRLTEQIALLSGNEKNVKRLLLLSATSQSLTLEEVVKSYQGAGMDGCVLTKIDEAVGIGSVLDIIVRHRITVHYVTNGQRVPEDLHLAKPLYLIDRAFKSVHETNSHFALQEEEYPLIMANEVANVAEMTQPVAAGQDHRSDYRG